MNSSRVVELRLKRPRTALVVIMVLGFLTPRIDAQRCCASITTPTPIGSINSSITVAIC